MSRSLSASPAPSSPRVVELPNDTLMVEFANVDPARALDNPKYDGPEVPAVSAEVREKLFELLEQYRKLTQANMELTLQTLHSLKELTRLEVYEALDKAYVDVPDVAKLDSAWLCGPDGLTFLAQKQNLHLQIQASLETLRRLWQGQSTRPGAPADAASDRSVEDEVAPPKKKKNKGRKGGKLSPKAVDQ